MSKKNRYKYRARENVAAASSPAAASSVVRSADHRSSNAEAQHAAEYKIISGDLVRLVVLNGIMLAAVLVVYYTNRTSGYLERLYEQLF